MFTRERLTRWTDALRANPEQQISGMLTDGKGFCCLGKLCSIEKIPKMTSRTFLFMSGNEMHEADAYLDGSLANEFGSRYGNFKELGMPNLRGQPSADVANDSCISWLEIAEHFDKYYPCSDEPPKELNQ